MDLKQEIHINIQFKHFCHLNFSLRIYTEKKNWYRHAYSNTEMCKPSECCAAVGKRLHKTSGVWRRSSLSSRAKLLICKTYIRPTMAYAAPAWGFISKSCMRRLQAVQNRALRLIGGYDRYTRNDVMHSDLEIVKLKSFMKHLALKLYVSDKRSRNKYICRLGTDTLVDNQRVPKRVHTLE